MSEFLKVLLNFRSLRAALRELSLDQLKEAHEKIEAVYLERLALAEKEHAAQADWLNFKQCSLMQGLTQLSWWAAPQPQRPLLNLNELLVRRNTVTLITGKSIPGPARGACKNTWPSNSSKVANWMTSSSK